jgi:hypothetical protein
MAGRRARFVIETEHKLYQLIDAHCSDEVCIHFWDRHKFIVFSAHWFSSLSVMAYTVQMWNPLPGCHKLIQAFLSAGFFLWMPATVGTACFFEPVYHPLTAQNTGMKGAFDIFPGL